MQLSEFLKTISGDPNDSIKSFARRCGTTAGQLRQVAGGYRRAGESLAINIERESAGAVTCEELRPDVDWAYLRSTSVSQTSAA
ncbi:transcriptional regulator [Pseudohongiella spirulinae]|uniref:Helix-turn-helix domain-containing protein n=1 Tax=Pseudohongiella spirulinae TaxID=1249552 RepID=A0A0S2KF61_9GAMM|nr:YdaS family helix-turn-helix protein [Pseudohongiella spirulinae]ALO46594.1 hypothetical protein PS2015_1951 [Pseudohongiella spirulinae]